MRVVQNLGGGGGGILGVSNDRGPFGSMGVVEGFRIRV